MFKKLTTLITGNTLASLGIAMVINSGLGCFSVTSANLAISNFFGISLGTAGMLVELIILLIATYRGEGIGLTAVCNAFYGSYAIDFFRMLLPSHILMVFGLLIIPFGWALMGKAGLGDTGCNVLMNSILKQTNKSIGLVRGVQECLFMLIGFLGARQYVTWFTIALSFGLGYLLQFVYRLIKYDPTKINHKFLIQTSGGKTCLKEN